MTAPRLVRPQNPLTAFTFPSFEFSPCAVPSLSTFHSFISLSLSLSLFLRRGVVRSFTTFSATFSKHISSEYYSDCVRRFTPNSPSFAATHRRTPSLCRRTVTRSFYIQSAHSSTSSIKQGRNRSSVSIFERLTSTFLPLLLPYQQPSSAIFDFINKHSNGTCPSTHRS